MTDRKALREALENAVISHLMTDVPYGVLLSGGLDSSITAALAQKHAEMRVEDHEQSRPGGRVCTHSQSGWKDHRTCSQRKRPQTTSARCTMASHSPSRKAWMHWKKSFYHLETYDVTTIRAATPMYLMARKIRAMGIKMVLSGEGADEIFGGYLYFHKAPDPAGFPRGNRAQTLTPAQL